MMKDQWSPRLVAQSVADAARGSFPVEEAASLFLALTVLMFTPSRRGGKVAEWPSGAELKDAPDKWFLASWNELELRRPLLQGVAADLRWADRDGLPARVAQLRELIQRLALVELREILSDPDVSDRVFQELLTMGGRFQIGAIEPPRAVTDVVAALAAPKEGMTIYDPACGFGAFLVACARVVRKSSGDPMKLELHGQDRSARACAIARMRCALAGLGDAVIECADALSEPRFTEDRSLRRFDVVVSNPPFGMAWEPQATADPFGRFAWVVPPRSRADSAFLLHAIASTGSTGRAVIVTSQGVLFRGGSDEEIRRRLVQEDIIEAIIGLPDGTFATTGIATAILVLNRAKVPRSRDQVLFIELPSGDGERTRRRKLDHGAVEFALAAYAGQLKDAGAVRSVVRTSIDPTSMAFARYMAPRARDIEATDLRELAEQVVRHERARDTAEVEMDRIIRELSNKHAAAGAAK